MVLWCGGVENALCAYLSMGFCHLVNVSVLRLGLIVYCFQCFDAVGWATGRASACKKTEW